MHNAYLPGRAYLRYAYFSDKLRTKKFVNPFWKMSRHAPGERQGYIKKYEKQASNKIWSVKIDIKV